MHYYQHKHNQPDGWQEVDLMERRRGLPILSCCYALYFDGELKYIGSTNNLRNRFSGHAIRYGYGRNIISPWCNVSDECKITIKFKPSRKYGDWTMIESRLVMRLQPEFNQKLKGRKR